MNKIMLMKVGIGLIILSLFYFCTDQEKTKNNNIFDDIEHYLTDGFVIKFPDTIPFDLALCNLNEKEMFFSAYNYPYIYVYDVKKQNFNKLYLKPIDTLEVPVLINFYFRDSVIYYVPCAKKIITCKDNKVAIVKQILEKYPNYCIYGGGDVISDSSNIYFQIRLASNGKDKDYYKENSELPNFTCIKRNLSKDTLLPLQYRIKESRTKQMISSMMKYTVDSDSRVIFCFETIDTIYVYDYKTNQLSKYFVSSPLNFQPYWFNQDTCKDIDISIINLYNKSSTIPVLFYNNKYRCLVRIVTFYNPSIDKKENYMQIFNNKIELLKTIRIPPEYNRFPVIIGNDVYFLSKNIKERKHVYKKFNFDNIN